MAAKKRSLGSMRPAGTCMNLRQPRSAYDVLVGLAVVRLSRANPAQILLARSGDPAGAGGCGRDRLSHDQRASAATAWACRTAKSDLDFGAFVSGVRGGRQTPQRSRPSLLG